MMLNEIEKADEEYNNMIYGINFNYEIEDHKEEDLTSSGFEYKEKTEEEHEQEYQTNNTTFYKFLAGIYCQKKLDDFLYQLFELLLKQYGTYKKEGEEMINKASSIKAYENLGRYYLGAYSFLNDVISYLYSFVETQYLRFNLQKLFKYYKYNPYIKKIVRPQEKGLTPDLIYIRREILYNFNNIWDKTDDNIKKFIQKWCEENRKEFAYYIALYIYSLILNYEKSLNKYQNSGVDIYNVLNSENQIKESSVEDDMKETFYYLNKGRVDIGYKILETYILFLPKEWKDYTIEKLKQAGYYIHT